MADVIIECPNCNRTFKLNETLAAPMVEETRRRFQREFEEKEVALKAQREVFAEELKSAEKSRKDVERERLELAKQKEQLETQVEEKVRQQRSAIAKEEAKKARQKFDEELQARDQSRLELEAALKLKDEKLAEARKAELEFLKKKRELDDKIKAADVDVEKRVAEVLGPEREKARREAEEQQRLKIAEKEKTITDLQAKLQDAIRKAEQGSQQMQGEIQELDIERRLREAFPRDTIEPVPKGQHGGDTLHRVLSPQGQLCGTILWESKRTKGWIQNWTDKLKQDQRTAKADIGVIVTQAMPRDFDTFGEVDCIWVTCPALAVPLACVLRAGMIEAFMARRASDGQQDKMAILYQYFTGPQFRQRIQALKDAFETMEKDLADEMKVMNKQWAKRQKQIERVMLSTVGMYGDLQAIAGTTLKEIEGFELRALTAD